MSAELALGVAVLLRGGVKDAVAVREAVAQLGGWPATIRAWSELGGEHAVLAAVWEVRGVLQGDPDLVAEHLGCEEEAVRRLAFDLESFVAADSLREAAVLAGWVAEVFTQHLQQASDPEIARAAEWWRRRWAALTWESAKGADGM